MKKIYLALIALILIVPCTAQAYYVSYTPGISTGNVQVTLNEDGASLDATSYLAPLFIEGTFTIYSDYGTDIVRDVDVSISQYLTAISDGTVNSTLSISGAQVLDDTFTANGLTSYTGATVSGTLSTATTYFFSYQMFAQILSDTDMDIVITSIDAPTATPIPGAVWLLGSGLVGLVGIRRKMM